MLLTGPSGTGKSQLARAIHDNSPRRDAPFVELNCGAIPEGLVESELFGALPGSFSGATRRIRGKVEAAEGGTLFLDEVGELPLATQVKLLQLLQSDTFYRLGSDLPSTVDLRVVAATNADIDLAVSERRFREDLYHRLNVVRIEVPTLSDRPEDIAVLARHFCGVLAERHGLQSVRLAPAAARMLTSDPWPGNVRELANRIEWAVLQAAAEGADEVRPTHLTETPASSEETVSPGWQAATRRFQRDLLTEALHQAEGNRSEAARRLGISRAYLYEAMKSLGVEPEGR